MAKFRSASGAAAKKLGRSIVEVNLLHRYGFEDQTANDEVGTAHGTVFGAVFVNTPVSDYGLQFDGIDDNMTIPYFDLSAPWSMCFWVNVALSNGAGFIWARGGEWELIRAQVTSNVYYTIYDHQCMAVIGLNIHSYTGTYISGFNHVGIVQSATEMKHYSNGTRITQYNAVWLFGISGDYIFGGSPGYYFKGVLDEILFYNVDLTDAQMNINALEVI